MVTILNASILTNYGSYDYEEISAEVASNLIKNGFISAIGHDSTAQVLTTLLGKKIERSRIMYSQEVGDVAIVFKLNGRPEEGKILTAEEIEKIGYKFGKLTRIS